ncbi:DUF3152 domain-containing protein [Streptomyces sp. NPDC102467]|uniref:DUF3152 domain-containing protein n=1 Tax=Streptomyces sp. NPDC102467 TaxID=3366179 RepID=UPI003830E91A
MRHAKMPSAQRPARTGPFETAGDATSHRARRSPARRVRLLWVTALALVAALTALVLYGNDGAARSATGGDRPRDTREAGVPQRPDVAAASQKPDDVAPSPSDKSPSDKSPSDTSTSRSGPGSGSFTTATASGKAVGTGTVRRYKVEVEAGTGVSANSAAAEIHGILGDRRGWTANGRDGFRLVSSGSYDFEVKIATPDTVDRICGAAGLHTRGEVNCDVGDQVIVNLKRWNTGSPQFSGPLHEYRALIINHEVGHRIGHGHETCPGPGLPAPAMMQQIDGLRGCRANAWPYDSHGKYLGGPSVT